MTGPPDGDESAPSPAEVIGLEVVNRHAQILGEIVELVPDPETGETVFAILSTGGEPVEEERLSPLPWRMLHWDPERRVLIADLSPDRMAMGPYFSRRARPETESWAAQVRYYYGYGDPPPARPPHVDREVRLADTPVSLPSLGHETVGPTLTEGGPLGVGPESGLTAEEEEGRTAEADVLLPGGPGEERRPLSEEDGQRPESEGESLGAGETPGPMDSGDDEEADDMRRRAA